MAVLLLVLIIAISIFAIIRFKKRKAQEEADDDTYSFDVSSQLTADPTPTAPSTPVVSVDRRFTLAELKQAPEGKYSWDDTGCVFEINPDGTVTIVGNFDPEELKVDPVKEMFDRLNDEGLLDMLPAMWCYFCRDKTYLEGDTFILTDGDSIKSSQIQGHTYDDIHNFKFDERDFDGDKSVVIYEMCRMGRGRLILMPRNEQEFILSLGAQACILRVFGGKVDVKISSPASMGAFGVAMLRPAKGNFRISFAFGEGDDYMCCDMSVEDGACFVERLDANSIIHPAELSQSHNHIARGCLAEFFILDWDIKNHVLVDMMPYAVSLLLKEDDKVIKIYDLINKPVNTPTMRSITDLEIKSGQTLSALIGSNEIIDDVMTESGAPLGTVKASVVLEANLSTVVIITSNNNEYKVNIGKLIG